MRSKELSADLERESVKQAKRAAKVARTPIATPQTARVLAEMTAEDKAALRIPQTRRLSQVPTWAINLPVKRYATNAARKAARAASQKRYQAKANLDVAATTARREKERVRQRTWVTTKRAKGHAAKRAQLATDHGALYRFWLTHWVANLPKHSSLKWIALKGY